MSIPYELTLALCDGTYRLCANPIKEMESLFDGNQTFEKVELKGKQAKRIELAPSAYMIKLKCEQKNAVLKMTLFGRTYTLDLGANQLNFGCDRTLPLSLSQSQVELTMIVDRCSAEMFLDRGKIYNGSVDEKTYSDYTLPYLEFLSDEDLVIENLQAIRLKSIWK
jgi:sucrose-6-phosphate hydrolase SacC (GH32 family)